MAERCAIIGSGLAALTAYATLRRGGLESAEIAVFGDDSDPAGAWRPRAHAIGQVRMRSESDGHCLPASWPGLAVGEAVERRSPLPVVRSLLDRYTPTVERFLQHVAQVRERCGWDTSFRRARIERMHATADGFELDSWGVFRHVLVATGHPGLNVPAKYARDPRAVHCYQPHDYARRVAVVGAGMAAATEWLNALAAGSEVVSVRRREPERRPLNLPRPLFTKRGLAAFHATAPPERVVQLERLSLPSYPPGHDWDEPLELATREGRFRVEAEVNGAEQVICATGFLRGFRHDRLLTRLVDEHGLETHGQWIALAPDATVPALTDRSRTLALAGVPAQWAFPAADTLAGAKYVARRFLRQVRCRTR